MKTKKEAKNENDVIHLNGFVNFINSKNGRIRKKNGYGKGKPAYPNQLLFELTTVGLVKGWKPDLICSLTGYLLYIHGSTKELSLDEMDSLYAFIEERNTNGTFKYIPNGNDFIIIDGNSFDFNVNWNGIKFDETGGNTMPDGLREFIDYCSKIISN